MKDHTILRNLKIMLNEDDWRGLSDGEIMTFAAARAYIASLLSAIIHTYSDRCWKHRGQIDGTFLLGIYTRSSSSDESTESAQCVACKLPVDMYPYIDVREYRAIPECDKLHINEFLQYLISEFNKSIALDNSPSPESLRELTQLREELAEVKRARMLNLLTQLGPAAGIQLSLLVEICQELKCKLPDYDTSTDPAISTIRAVLHEEMDRCARYQEAFADVKQEA